MKKNKNKKKQEKSSLIVLIVCLIIVFLIVMNLQNINNLFLNRNNEEVKPVEEKEEIPTRYQCFYGPMFDEFYNYTKSEYVIFDFDENGNVSNVTSEEKYQVTTIEEYNTMLSILLIDSENVNYDTENYIVTVVNDSSNKFPINYKSLNKYLSSNQYTCSKE